MSKEIEERFLNDVKDHKMKVLRDDGVDRHLRFRKDSTIIYCFDIITWPGHLLITGDCGTYVFQRLEDMFRFFRMHEEDFNRRPENKLHINPGYWSEKALAVDRHCGLKKYSPDTFRNSVREYAEMYLDDKDDSVRKEEMERVEIQIMSFCDNEWEAVSAVHNYDSKHLHFVDFWEYPTREYDYHFIWNIYAIVWGIQQYDELKTEVSA